MKSKKYIKVIAILLVVIAFLFISDRFMKEEKTSFKVDPEQFEIAQSKEELNHLLINHVRYNKDQLFKITRYDLMTDIEDVEIPLIDEQRDLRIESIWNNHLELIITYSFNMLPSDRSPESIPYLRVNGGSLHPDGKDPITLDFQNHVQPGGKFWPNDGVVLENRMYRRALLVPSIDNEVFEKMSEWIGESKSHEKIYEALDLIHQVDLKGVELVTKQEGGEQSKSVQDIPIEYRFMSHDAILETIELNQTAQLDEQSTITYTKFEKRLKESRIYLSIDSNKPLSSLKYKVNGLRGFDRIYKDENGESYIKAPQFRYQRGNDGEFKLSILSGFYASEDELNFTISKGDLEPIQNGQNEREFKHDLGEINNVHFKFDEIRRVKGRFGDMDILFYFNVEIMDGFDRDLNFRIYRDGEQQVDPYYEEREIYPFIEVKDENNNGVTLGLLPPGEGTQLFGMTEEDFQKVEELNFRLFNIPQQVDFEENEVTFTIQ
ncbi:hypothetical protein [Pseudalkalibacillus berkeleyi]|uniref:DUF4179 domain-containing protein n=1 Tax=Pseudalkalibacillus berkeleyi TaxID=1069813 RepID=A0ABS9GY35_9BACL|nr:hypothetical protein [Pseudalkalibacillus berkeleyi]MCF6136520.1 hypothetical protein [Pseudalkalibacillus berkeleyi]